MRPIGPIPSMESKQITSIPVVLRSRFRLRRGESSTVCSSRRVNMSIKTQIQQFIRDEEGVTMIEYALLAALIAVVAIGIITTVGGDVVNVFTAISTALQNAVG